MDVIHTELEIECVAKVGDYPITIGRIYKVYAVDELQYMILNDKNMEDWYNKHWFNVVSWN